MFKIFFGKKAVFLSGLMLLVSLSAQANPVCKTTVECQELSAEVNARPSERPKFLGAETIVYSKSQREAVDYCVSLGGHLPSIRELAKFAQRFGANIASSKLDDSYRLVRATNMDLNSERYPFYYSSAGYRTPRGLMENNNWFWSSERSVDSGHAFALFVGAIIGNVGHYNDGGAVWCVSGPDVVRGLGIY